MIGKPGQDVYIASPGRGCNFALKAIPVVISMAHEQKDMFGGESAMYYVCTDRSNGKSYQVSEVFETLDEAKKKADEMNAKICCPTCGRRVGKKNVWKYIK